MMVNDLSEIRSQNVVLQGRRIYLEPFSERHLSEKYVAWLKDPTVCQFNRHGNDDYTMEKARVYLENVSRSENTMVFAICVKGGFEEYEHIGNISLNDISWEDRSGEISILIGETQHWGKRFGTEAVQLVIQFGFETLKLRRVWVEMTKTNIGMINIAKKLGFEEIENPGRFLDKTGKAPVRLVKYELWNPSTEKRIP